MSTHTREKTATDLFIEQAQPEVTRMICCAPKVCHMHQAQARRILNQVIAAAYAAGWEFRKVRANDTESLEELLEAAGA